MNCNSENIQEPYKSGYIKAANGKWEYLEYFIISHIEKRQAYPQKRRRAFAIHEI